MWLFFSEIADLFVLYQIGKSDNHQLLEVADIIELVEIEMELEKKMEFDESLVGKGKEEILSDPDPTGICGQKTTKYPLLCRGIRIGTYKISSYNNIPVNLSTEAISFRIPTLFDSKNVTVNLRRQDITRVLVHFGYTLPLMFIFTTINFAENIKTTLSLDPEMIFYDPLSKRERIKKITFVIDSMSEEQRNFIRYCFPGAQKVKEIDQKEANDILMKSTPSPLLFKN